MISIPLRRSSAPDTEWPAVFADDFLLKEKITIMYNAPLNCDNFLYD